MNLFQTKLERMVIFSRVLFSACLISTKLLFTSLPKLIAWIESQKIISLNVTDLNDLSDLKESKILKFIYNVTQFKIFVIRKNCLKKSLLFYYWLHRFGISNIQLNVGALLKEERINGHAWITINDEVYFDNESKTKDYYITFSTGVKKK